MEHEFKLNNKFAFNDYDLNLLSTMINGKNNIVIILFLNTHLKMNSRKENFFKIPIGVISKKTLRSTSSIWRDVRSLVDQKILVKFDSGFYGWNMPGINNKWLSLHKKPEPKRTEQHKERPPKLVFNQPDNPFEGLLN